MRAVKNSDGNTTYKTSEHLDLRLHASPSAAMEHSWSLQVVGGAGAIVLVYVASRLFSAKNRNLPPGPRRLPVVGNLFNMPGPRPWIQFTHWAAEFGSSPRLHCS